MPQITPIPSCPDYGVTKSGRVYRINPAQSNQHGGRTTRQVPYPLTPIVQKSGYAALNIYSPGEDGIVKHFTRYIHHLVAEAYLGPRPDGCVIHHKNGCRTDNRLANLEYRQPHRKA